MIRPGRARPAGDGVRMEYRDPATRERLVAIERIDWRSREGEFVSIVGPSGCGKTTFLKIVNGLLPATGGEIEIAAVTEPGPGPRDGLPGPSLFPWYTVVRNVATGWMPGRHAARGQASGPMPFIKLVGLEGFEQHYPYELSGGMQQRANLARALRVDPEVLLMDEPFAALDAQTRELMQAELLRIWTQTRKTVLFITHQIDEAIYLADRVARDERPAGPDPRRHHDRPAPAARPGHQADPGVRRATRTRSGG